MAAKNGGNHGKLSRAELSDRRRPERTAALGAGAPRGVQIKSNGGTVSADVRVLDLNESGAIRGLFRITFDCCHPVSDEHRASGGDGHGDAARVPERACKLERELQHTKESHQSTIEELATASEDLQSGNKELQTVNAELQEKVKELSRANNDLEKLLNATDIATVFLDNELRTKLYTEQARQINRLVPTDVGTPIGDLVSSLQYHRLVEGDREVSRTLVEKEIAVQGVDQLHCLMRILPWRTTEEVIEGLVVTFVDVTEIKAPQEEPERPLDVLRTSPARIFWQDRNLQFTWGSSSIFGRRADELDGESDREIFERGAAGRLRELKKEVLATGALQGHRIDRTVAGERRSYQLYIEPRQDPSGQRAGLSRRAMDITAQQ